MTGHAIKMLAAGDETLARVIRKVGPPGLKPRLLPPFESLVHAVIHQQLSGKAAGTILGRFQALFSNGQFPEPKHVLVVETDRLRAAGLSRAKANYVRDIAEKTLAGIVPSLEECHSLSDAELIERLTTIRGVGRWTVEMLLIFNLGRPDVLPVHDLGVRKGFQIAYRKRNLPTPAQLERFGRRWQPNRSTAAWYLWRAADFLEGTDW
jgi:3-methyladenine DNA glycosylase/8-oxoguanine DNA glycosylase